MRLHVPGPLQADTEFVLPPGPTRHAQVRRVQPGDAITLFDGSGADWPAAVLAVSRNAVRVRTGLPQPVDRELPLAVTLALGMPANERMDTLVEKAVELGVARVQPLLCERSVLRLAGERAERKRQHWQAIAEAACEQCGRSRVPVVAPVLGFGDWLQTLPADHSAGRNVVASLTAANETRLLLSLAPEAVPLHAQAAVLGRTKMVIVLSGPEGGLTADEQGQARAIGFIDTALGPRVLRADTAPLAALAWIGLCTLRPAPA